jgi:hypothetical protein
MAQAEKDDWPSAATLVAVSRRLNHGWELYDDHGTLRWYSETKPGFADELPTEPEIALLRELDRAGEDVS